MSTRPAGRCLLAACCVYSVCLLRSIDIIGCPNFRTRTDQVCFLLQQTKPSRLSCKLRPDYMLGPSKYGGDARYQAAIKHSIRNPALAACLRMPPLSALARAP